MPTDHQTTPLLLLLDSILSQKPERIQQAQEKVSQVLLRKRKHEEDDDDLSEFKPDISSKRLVSMKTAPTPHVEFESINSASQLLANNKTGTMNLLIHDVRCLLQAFPNIASIPSKHDGSLPLHFAASIGNVEIAKLLYNEYPQAATKPNSKGKIPLHYAAREGRQEMVTFFLYNCPETASIKSKKHKLALHFAAGDGHIEIVRQLLHIYPQGTSITSAKGKLPLHFAARWGHLQIASDLLLIYPDAIRCLDNEGSLSLHDAAREQQILMSKFLIERYPTGLCTSNLRGEIPLFSAVRSENLDLVILYLQGWPYGGKYIVSSANSFDNVNEWDWNIIELCLRGSVNNFSNCPLLEGKIPPAVCCPHNDGYGGYYHDPVGYRSSPTVSYNKINDNNNILGKPSSSCTQQQQYPFGLSASQEAGIRTSPTAMKRTSSFVYPFPSASFRDNIERSKSPILEQDGNIRSKKHGLSSPGGGGSGKRSRFGSDQKKKAASKTKKNFLALHAAFASGASSHILRRVVAKFPEQLSESDEWGRLPLHWAVQHERIIHTRDTMMGSCNNDSNRSSEGTRTVNTDKIQGQSDRNQQRESKDLSEEANHVVQIVLEEILKTHPGAAFEMDSHQRLPLHLAITARADFRIIQALVKTNPSSGVDPVTFNPISPFFNKPPIYMATEYDCDLSTTFMLLRGDPSVVSCRKRPSVSNSSTLITKKDILPRNLKRNENCQYIKSHMC